MNKNRDAQLNAHGWLEQAERSLALGAVFNGYFEAYISLASAAANRFVSQALYPSNNSDDVDEGIAIEEAMARFSREINQFLESPEGDRYRKDLWNRTVHGEEDVRIIGEISGNEKLRSARERLAGFWSPLCTSSLSAQELEEQARHLAYLFRIVRNRLFHGTKVYDDRGSDADLLRKVAPLVVGVARILIPESLQRKPPRPSGRVTREATD